MRGSSLHRQKARLAKKIERERTAIAPLPELSPRILDFIPDHGRASVGDLTRATGANRNTIKDHIRRLARTGQLKRHGTGRGAWYALGWRIQFRSATPGKALRTSIGVR